MLNFFLRMREACEVAKPGESDFPQRRSDPEFHEKMRHRVGGNEPLKPGLDRWEFSFELRRPSCLCREGLFRDRAGEIPSIRKPRSDPARGGAANPLGVVEINPGNRQLAVFDQGTVLYVDVIESPHEFRLSSRIGTRRSLHVTALGKALAAFLPAESLENVLSSITFQPATPRTIMNLLQFRQELEKIRRQGFAVDDEEAVQGARCVSGPILNSDGEPIAAVSVSGPVTRVSPSQVPALAGAVTSAARAISAAMGFSRHEPETIDRRRAQKVVPAPN
jgi:Bacterial transcriptional regulator